MFGLDQILSPLPVDTFMSDYLGKKALHIPGPPEKFAGLYGWSEINNTVNNARKTFEGLRLVHETKPLAHEEMRRMSHWLTKGATLVINHIQDIDPIADQLAASLSGDMNSAVNINVYVSFPTRQGFDNHYDTHDVFILQTAGKKVWKVFEPTRRFPLDRDPSEQKKLFTPPKDGEYLSCELSPGDVLYIPRGHWHYAVSSEACIHLTVSYNNRSAIDLLSWLFNEWRDREDFLRQDFPLSGAASLLGDGTDAALDAHIEQFRAHMATLLEAPRVKEQLLRWVQVENGLRPQVQLPEMASIDQTPFTPDVRFQLAPNQKVVARYDDASGHSELLARGRVVGLAKVPKPLVEMILKPGQTFTGEQMLAAAPGVTWESLRVMVTDLFVAGLIVLADVEVG